MYTHYVYMYVVLCIYIYIYILYIYMNIQGLAFRVLKACVTREVVISLLPAVAKAATKAFAKSFAASFRTKTGTLKPAHGPWSVTRSPKKNPFGT